MKAICLNLLYYKDILCLSLGNTCYKGLRMCPACRKQYPFHSLFKTYHTSARNRLPMVGGSLRVLQLLAHLRRVAMN
jgi:hypothetical protein